MTMNPQDVVTTVFGNTYRAPANSEFLNAYFKGFEDHARRMGLSRGTARGEGARMLLNVVKTSLMNDPACAKQLLDELQCWAERYPSDLEEDLKADKAHLEALPTGTAVVFESGAGKQVGALGPVGRGRFLCENERGVLDVPIQRFMGTEEAVLNPQPAPSRPR